jgi:O-antigen ligase
LIAYKYPEHKILRKYTAQHSNIIQFLVETGVLGLTAWLLIWVFYFKYAFARFGEVATNPSNFWARLGGLAAVMGFHTYGLVESNYFDSEVAMLTFFMMGLSLARSKNESSGAQ